MRQVVATVGLLAGALAAAACSNDGPAASTGSAAAATTTASADECGDCRDIESGTVMRDGETSIGVGPCGDDTCRVVVLEADGTESELDVAAGDQIDGEETWEVVAADADGVVVRPAS